jgi:hypothetical protein
VLGNGHWNPISTTKPKKWVQYPSITILKSIVGGIYIYYVVCILALESYFIFVLSFKAQQKRLLLQMQFNLHLSKNQIFTHHHVTKAIETATKYHTNMGIASSSSLEKD